MLDLYELACILACTWGVADLEALAGEDDADS